MVDTTKKREKGSISEEYVSTLLLRYSPTTVLTLLQEVARIPDAKIDWNALLKNTSTGISCAREYQMVWRHLAYRHTLVEELEDGAQPLEDDSDLEYELEHFPSVSNESLTEAIACVKVLIASGSPSGSSVRNSVTVEAPLTINLPNSQSSGSHLEILEATSSTLRTYVTVPVSVQRQPIPAPTFSEGLDTNGSATIKRKRKPWSEAEDLELIAAVQRCGEGNWANIVIGDFKGDRTPSQLSQRWSIIRKRANLNVGASSNGTQLSEAQLAARHAMSLALNMPVKNLTSASTICPRSTSEKPVSVQVKNQFRQTSTPAKPYQTGSMSAAVKSRVTTSKKSPTKSNFSSDSLVRATAVAAGARIASPSDAVSLLKAAQAKNAIHIMPTSASSIKPNSDPHLNVHYISTAKTVLTSHTRSAKAVSLTVQHNPSVPATSLNKSSEQSNIAGSSLATESRTKQVVRTLEENKIHKLGDALKDESQEDEICGSRNTVTDKSKGEKAASLKPGVSKDQSNAIEFDRHGLLEMETLDDDDDHKEAVNGDCVKERKNTNENEMRDLYVEHQNVNRSEVEKYENHNMNKKEEEPIMAVADECSEIKKAGAIKKNMSDI